jgi:hypothetical protein
MPSFSLPLLLARDKIGPSLFTFSIHLQFLVDLFHPLSFRQGSAGNMRLPQYDLGQLLPRCKIMRTST